MTPELTRRGFLMGSAAIVLTPGLLMPVRPALDIATVQKLNMFDGGPRTVMFGDHLHVTYRCVDGSYATVTFGELRPAVYTGVIVTSRRWLQLVRADGHRTSPVAVQFERAKRTNASTQLSASGSP